jgi:Brp/Blh family beta-carotene 15,15'-monooxygenase
MKNIEIIGKFLGVIIGIAYLLFFQGNEIYEWICFISILVLVGIPHGAIDHLLLSPEINKKKLFNFILKYLVIIVAYLAIWMIFPTWALLAFILMSAYHFGQSHFIKLKIKKLERLTYLSLGLYFLSTILWGDFEYTTAILSNIIEVSSLKNYGFPFIILTFSLSTVLIVINLKKDAFWLLLESILLGILLYHLPLLLGFIIYFGFWHSLPSMNEEFEALKNYLRVDKVKEFIKKLLPFTLISLIGITLILVIFSKMMNTDQLTLLFFVMVSLISAPHIWYMNVFLDSRKV